MNSKTSEQCGAQLKDPATGRIGHCIKPKGHHNVTGSRDGWTGRLHQINSEEEGVTEKSVVEGTFHTYLKITPETIEALRWLRKGWNGDNSERAITCLDILDNAGIFAPIDEATGYDVDPAPERVSKCTCPELSHRTGFHLNGCPGDPAEWGDMAYTTAPLRKGGSTRREDARKAEQVIDCTCGPGMAAQFGHRPECPIAVSVLKVRETRRTSKTKERRPCPADGCTLSFAVNKDGTLHAHLNDMLEPCLQGAAEGAQPQTVQCGHCRGDYKPKKDGTLRKHSCWNYDQTLKTIVYGALDIHGRGTKAV